jgi:imidazolonepropionase-like amidohydrolase
MKIQSVAALVVAGWLVGVRLAAQEAEAFQSVRAPLIVFTHANVIDGRGGPAVADQTVTVRDGRIAAISAATTANPVPDGAKVIDLTGKSLLPGLVMVHEHLFFTARANSAASFHVNEMDYSFPRLYLACGLTTIRTAGSIEPYTDLEVKSRVDHGTLPGPRIHLTGPYLEGSPSIIPQLHPVDSPNDAARLVDFWAGKGFTSFKLYMHLTRAAAEAAITTAHAHHAKVTGHLGAITYREAADLGIDNLEHGFFVASDFVKDKKPDVCPDNAAMQASFAALDVDSAAANALIRYLIDKHVALTSTLPVFEANVPGRPMLSGRELDAFSDTAREMYLRTWAKVNSANDGRAAATFKKMQALEKKFHDAGGLLLAGTDPTGYGGVIAGYGSLRELELLVEAGLAPTEAIHVATLNGAKYLGVDREVGSIEVGKAADLIVVDGDPAESISDLRKTETVFKDGVGYDARKLADSAKGCVGIE